ncbi:hypothetical protein Ddc_11649 [Ditylenchus destructor]|nr:hypothetical protein Ddc_11649 [Ditylenchus destructor]
MFSANANGSQSQASGFMNNFMSDMWSLPLLSPMARQLLHSGMAASPSAHFSTTLSGTQNQNPGPSSGSSARTPPKSVFPQLSYADLLQQFPAPNQAEYLLQQQMIMPQILAASNKSGSMPGYPSGINDLSGNTASLATGSESRASSISDYQHSNATGNLTGGPSKRLQLDSEGNARCPVCDENIGSQPSQWSAHLEVERAKLIKAIESVKDEHFGTRMTDDGLQSSAAAHQTAHRKREQQLVRIRANQQKRLETQKIVTPSNGVAPKSTDKIEKSFCNGCQKQYDFLVVSSQMGDESRCLECFNQYQKQIGALPTTITQSPNDIDSRSNTTAEDGKFLICNLLSRKEYTVKNGRKESTSTQGSNSNGIENDLDSNGQNRNRKLPLKLKIKNGIVLANGLEDENGAPAEKRARHWEENENVANI